MYKELWNRNQKLYLTTFFLGFLCYGFLLFNNVLTGDNWMSVFHPESKNRLLVQGGRWFQVVIGKAQFGRLFAPTFTSCVFIICLSISSILLTECVGFKEKYSKYIFSSIFITFPFWNETAIFNMIRVPIGVALLLSCAASFVFIKSPNTSKWSNLIVTILLWLSISIYQTYIFFFITALIGYVLIQAQSPEFKFKVLLDILKNCLIVIVLTSILYIISFKTSLVVYDLKAISSGKYSFIDTNIDIIKNLKNTLSRTFSFWILPQILLPKFIKYIMAFFLVISLLSQFKDGFSESLKTLLKVVLLLALILSPWLLGVVKNEAVIYRYNAMTAMALVVSFVVTFTFEFSLLQALKYKFILYGIAGTIVASNLLQNNACHYALYLSNARDLSISQELLSRIHSFDDYDINNIYTLNIYGRPAYRNLERPFDIYQPENLFSGYNVINYGGIWDLTSSQRWNDSFKLLGEQADYRVKMHHKNKKFSLPNIRKVKAWPNKNALIYDEDNLTFHLILQ